MGVCCSSEKSTDEFVQEIKSLSATNLNLLKALILLFIEKENLGMAAQLMKVRNMTRRYYMEVAKDRVTKLKFESCLDQEELAELMSILVSEREELLAAYNVLSSKFSYFIGDTMLFHTKHSLYLERCLEDPALKRTYNRVKENCKKFENSGQEIAQLSKLLNYGKDLSPMLKRTMKEICTVTSHIANNKRRRITYSEASTLITPGNLPAAQEDFAPTDNDQRQHRRHGGPKHSLVNPRITRIANPVPELSRHESIF